MATCLPSPGELNVHDEVVSFFENDLQATYSERSSVKVFKFVVSSTLLISTPGFHCVHWVDIVQVQCD